MPTVTIGHLVVLRWYVTATVERMFTEDYGDDLIDDYLATMMQRMSVRP